MLFKSIKKNKFSQLLLLLSKAFYLAKTKINSANQLPQLIQVTTAALKIIYET